MADKYLLISSIPKRSKRQSRVCLHTDASIFFLYLLRLLSPALLGRLTPQPDSHERNPCSAGAPNTQNPYPCAADGPTSRPLVVRKMSDTDLPLFINVGKEGSLIVDAKVEDTVLVGKFKGGGINSAVRSLRNGFQRQTVEGREHGEFKLNCVGSWRSVGSEMIVRPFGEFDNVGLKLLVTSHTRGVRDTYDIILDTINRWVKISA